MGDLAEMHLNGVLCERCGSFIGEEVGYPRLCEDCKPTKKNKRKK